MTLPCGSSLCKPCLPPLYKRENITYPHFEGRAEGFICPFKDCGLEHSLGDCGTDVTLNKILCVVKGCMEQYKADSPELPLLLEEKLDLPRVVDSAMDFMPRSRVLLGGRIVASYILADMGELNYHSDLSYTAVDADSTKPIRALDVAVLETLQETARSELECQVCYQVMLDPLTTSCGHTFCRKCFARAMDHAHVCPMCRRGLPVFPNTSAEPSNKRITYLLQHLLPEILATRIETSHQEDAIDEQTRLPLFPCTLAYPQMPTFLHIFEPRYRLMIRRAVNSGSRKFGMLMYRQGGPLPGQSDFMPYGTVLFIERLELLPDGRSLIETRGMYRFRVIDTSILDGYLVGEVQRIDDIPVHEEESIEAQETSSVPSTADEDEAQLQQMSTQRLLEYASDFVEQARSKSARWLHQRVLAAYGQPPSDPAVFPYWLASVLPISESEKYLLLPTTSVRERLKIIARWIQRLEAARW
jgi:Lon protease-like protein